MTIRIQKKKKNTKYKSLKPCKSPVRVSYRENPGEGTKRTEVSTRKFAVITMTENWNF